MGLLWSSQPLYCTQRQFLIVSSLPGTHHSWVDWCDFALSVIRNNVLLEMWKVLVTTIATTPSLHIDIVSLCFLYHIYAGHHLKDHKSQHHPSALLKSRLRFGVHMSWVIFCTFHVLVGGSFWSTPWFIPWKKKRKSYLLDWKTRQIPMRQLAHYPNCFFSIMIICLS